MQNDSEQTENEIINEQTPTDDTAPENETPDVSAASETPDEQPKKPTKKQQFWEICKFTFFMASAGAIQLLSFTILYEWAACLAWWPSYLISIILSVIWSFTFNRKFTFKAANNIPLAMVMVIIYYCAFIPISVFGGNALERLWGEKWGILVTVLMMLINFVTEFIWDKFVVFNRKVSDRILKLFSKKDKQ